MTENVEDPPNPETPSDPGQPQYPDWFVRVTGVGTRAGRALLVPTLALITALIVGGIIIAVTDLDALQLWGEDPGEAFSITVTGLIDSYQALFVGSVGSIRAISETLFSATPLILAGLAVAVGFRAGLFNIGAEGQMLIGGMVALWIGITFSMPAILHIPLALIGAMVGGGLWAGIAGALKAKTGAHEVITTIMLNFIAIFLVLYLLKTDIFQAEGREDPISQPLASTAEFPRILGGDLRVNVGFLIAVGAAFFVYWLLFRSSVGFEFRAVGFNPDAARYAGMSVVAVYISVMAVSGALAGMAGANQIMGLEPYRAFPRFSSNIGFDAIALALLGRSHPFGVLWAGLLFGALRAGGRQMQGAAGVPLDIVLVMQALIIVLIAAPELIRSIYRVKPSEEEATKITRGWGA